MIKPVKLTKYICSGIMVAVSAFTIIFFIYNFYVWSFFGRTHSDEYTYRDRYVAQSSLGEITVVQSDFYNTAEKSYITIDGERIGKLSLNDMSNDENYVFSEGRNYFRFDYKGERYLLLFNHLEESANYKAGETFAALYYNSDKLTPPVFIEKLNFVVSK